MQKDAKFNELLMRGRSRFGDQRMVSRQEGIRATIAAMREGRPFYYLPDQDYGPRDAIFVPFFGVSAATVPGLSRIARLAGAKILPCVTRMLPGGAGYVLHIDAPWDNFPTGDVAADTRRMNEYIERRVLEMPEQYLWMHKRFKTRPRAKRAFIEQMKKLRTAVIGVGYMGKFHAEKFAASSNAELVAVVDADAARAKEIAATLGCAYEADYKTLLPRIEAACVAVPTEKHHAVVRACLEAGVHVLVEKTALAHAGRGRCPARARAREGPGSPGGPPAALQPPLFRRSPRRAARRSSSTSSGWRPSRRAARMSTWCST